MLVSNYLLKKKTVYFRICSRMTQLSTYILPRPGGSRRTNNLIKLLIENRTEQNNQIIDNKK